MYDSILENVSPETKTKFEFFCCVESFQYAAMCKRATTCIGTNGSTGKTEVWSVCCKTWGCEYCSEVKVRRLAWLCKGAAPNRMMTLTTNPNTDPEPTVAWLNTRRKVPELIRELRKGVKELEYLRVTESCKSGMPHYHLLLRSSFLPKAIIRREWERLTTAKIVDIGKVDQSFNSYHYLCKYLRKHKPLEWTERHVSYSRDFFNPADLEKTIYPEMENVSRTEDHPWNFLYKRYRGETIHQSGPGRWIVDHYVDEDNPFVEEHQLPIPPPPEPPPPPVKQQDLIDMQPSYGDGDSVKIPRRREKKST